jgi:hypothetical protein
MAFTKSSVGNYTIFEEAGLVLADNEGGNACTVANSSVLSTEELGAWEGKKIPVTLTVTTAAGGAGILDCDLMVSGGSATTGDTVGNGSVSPLWATGAAGDLGSGAAANATASYSGVIDASSLYAPYVKFAITTTAVDLSNANGRVTIKIAIPGGEGTNSVDQSVGGVGADPS